MMMFKRPRFPVPSTRVIFLSWLVVGAVLAALVLCGVVALTKQNHQIETLQYRADLGRADRADLRADSERQQEALDKANAKLLDAGKSPVVPPVPQADDTPQTRYVPVPPSFAAVLAAVSKQIGAALRAECGGPCRGPSGADGQDSTVPGPAGAPGKDSTVPGPAGKDGKDAPKVTAVDCADDGTLTFTFDDGTTITASGSCRSTTLP